MKSVHFFSLGCSKNQVDSEVMLGHLQGSGLTVVDRPEQAELIVVNTCAFIDAAKEESVDAILEAARYKKKGRCTTLVVAGCLSQRYAPELAKEIPEVDHFLGTGNFETIAWVLGLPLHKAPRGRLPIVDGRTEPKGHQREHGGYHPRLVGRNALVPYRHDVQSGARSVTIPDPDFTISARSPRQRTGHWFSTYLKISEGCSNTCAFCIIPKLRGPMRSRPMADVLAEAEALLADGVVELNLIAQDLCAYGTDLSPRQSLAELLRALDGLGSQAGRPVWIRCMYAYPKGLTSQVIDVLAESAAVLPYLDLPLQHISDGILRRMRRGKGGEATRELVRTLRRRVPNLTLRTTFITGLPGETDADFRELCDFVQELRFERAGVFAYSPEEDTPAAKLSGQVAPDVARERRDRLMELQLQISREQQADLLGSSIDVLVEGVSEETDLLLQGRHQGQAPEIDGLVYINDGQATPGDIVSVRIDQALDYDVVGGVEIRAA